MFSILIYFQIYFSSHATAPLLQLSESRDPSDIILIAAQETFLLIIIVIIYKYIYIYIYIYIAENGFDAQ